MSIEASDNQHHLDITTRLSFLREILLNQGLTSLGEDSKVDLNTARDLNDTRHSCRCGSVISIGSFDALLDTVFVMFSKERLKSYRADNILCSIAERYSEELCLLRQLYPSTDDFISKDVVGIGQFGEVKVVEEKCTGEIFAMKTIRKSQLFQLGPSVACFKEERDVMVRANKSPWIASLAYSFQDSANLYLIMTFYAGGDLLNVLEQFDPMKEEMARFYLSEISTAIHFVHEMGYIHRDVKPENVLVDTSGHIKLADFGSAAALTEDGRIVGQIPFPVGTPEYVAPEVLSVLDHATGSKSCMYGRECDWWSLGVVAYEMLVGKTPFESGSRIETHANIQNFKKSLVFPPTPDLCKEAINLITSLCTGITTRIGYYEIVRHEFFAGIEWDELLTSQPPYIPNVKGPDDVSNFDNCDRSMTNRNYDFELSRGKNTFEDSDLCFIGYSYLPLMPSPFQDMPIPSGVTSTPNSQAPIGHMSERNVDDLKKLLMTKERELDMSMEERVLVEKESDLFKTQVYDLQSKLESERVERLRMEKHTLQLLEEVREGTRRVSEMREAEAVQKACREHEIVLRQLNQEKEVAMQRARRLEEELMLKKGVWDDQNNEMNELKKTLNREKESGRVEAGQYQEKINKLAEEAHAHITELKSKLEVKVVDLEESEDQLRQAQNKIAQFEKQLTQEKDLKESANTQISTLNNQVEELEKPQQSKVSIAKEEDEMERTRIQELEQELLENARTKEELESSEFRKERELQDMAQELIEVLSDRDHVQEELNILTEDMDSKEKEFATQKEIISQLEEELNAGKLQLNAYDEEVASRLEYKHKSIPIHPSGIESDTESTVCIADRQKALHEVRSHYQVQLTKLREKLEEEMKKHALTRDKLAEMNRVAKKKTSDVERSLEYQRGKLTNNEEKYKENILTLEKRNQDLQNQYNKVLGKLADMRRVQTTLEHEIQEMKKQEEHKDELRSKLSSAGLQEKIRDSGKEIDRLKTDLSEVNKLNKDYSDSVLSLQTELRKIRSSSLKTESQLQIANQQMKADKHNIERLRNSLKSLEQSGQGESMRNEESLRKELDELSGKLEHKSQRLEISEQELDDTKKALIRAENLYQVQIDSFKSLIEEEKRKYISYSDKSHGLEVELHRRNEEIQSLQRKEIDLANQMLQLKQQLREKVEGEIPQHKSQEASKEQINQLSQELAHEKASKEEAKIRAEEYKEQSESLSSEVKKRGEEVQRSNAQLNSLRMEYRALKDSELESSRLLNELKRKGDDRLKSNERCKRMEGEMESMKLSLELKNDHVCKLQTIESVKVNEIYKLENSLDQVKKELDSLRDENKKLQLERMEIEQKVSNLRTTSSRHELNSAQWAGEQSKLNDVISTLKNEALKLQGELIRAKDEVKKLKMVVRQLEKGQLSEPQRVLDLEDQIIECNTRIHELEEVREQFNKSKIDADNHARLVKSLREDNSHKELEVNILLEDKQGVEERNKTLALQLDLQYEELQKAKEEATCLRIQMQQLMATKHKLTVEQESLRKQLGEKTEDEVVHSNEEKSLKEQRYRIETQLQQQAKLIDYLTDGKQDSGKWSSKVKRKEMEPMKDRPLRPIKASKPSQILYPPKTNGSDSGVTSIESDHDPFTPPDQIEHTNIPHISSAPLPNFTVPAGSMECTPLGSQRCHGMISKVKKTLSGRRFEAPGSITGSKQLNSKSLKEVTIPKIDTDKVSPVSLASNNTYSISSCSENDSHSKRSKDIDECDIASPPKKVCSDSSSRIVPKHFFATKICKSSTVCDACSLPIKFGELKTKCAFCRAVLHPKCSPDYDAINACQSKQPPIVKPETEAIFDALPDCDWCKVLFWPTPRQAWEKYFVVLKDDSLLLYTHQPDDFRSSKATRTLKLGPFERAEITLHKEYNRKRLNSFTNANYACTLAMFFHQIPSGDTEGVYLQAPSSARKQFWSEILQDRINNLDINRSSYSPFTVEPIFENPATIFFFSALPLNEGKIILLAGYSALYVMSVPTWIHPWSPPIPLAISHTIAPIYSLKLFPVMGLIVMIAGKDRQIIVTHLETMVEYLSGIIRDRKKTMPKFISLPNTAGCQITEGGKVNELPFLCSFHQGIEGMNNHLMTHHNVPSNYSKCPLQLWHDRPLAHCTSILATPWKFLIGSHIILNYNPTKKLFRESQISMHDSEINDTKNLRNPIEILQMPVEGEFLLVYSEMGIFISRQGSGIFVNEEVILWNNTPIHAWIDEDKLFVVSLKKITVYHLNPGELPSNPAVYKFNIDGRQFLCYIPSIKSMVYTTSECNSTFLYSCKFMMNERVKRTCSTEAIKSVKNEEKRLKTSSMTDLAESVL